MEREKLISLKAMAALLDCRPKTFSKQVKEDNVPFTPVGKRRKFDAAIVRAYLAALEADRRVESRVVQFKPVRKSKVSALAEMWGL